MEISDDLLLSGISDGNVYYFVSEKILSSEPHFYICIKKGLNDVLIMTCCSSTYETALKYIRRNGLPEETLVHLHPENNPYLRKHTFVNCNNAFEFTKEDFIGKYKRGEIAFKGEIHPDDYKKIMEGLLISPDIEEEIKDVLKVA